MIFDPILSRSLYSLDSMDDLCIDLSHSYLHCNDASNNSPEINHDAELSKIFCLNVSRLKIIWNC
jgi:hypothetical protein